MRILCCLFFMMGWATFSHAQTVIYTEDFENGAPGWSEPITESDPGTTFILGRFDNSPMETARDFVVPANTDQLVIEFDFFRIDSWDNSQQFGFDRFQVDIDGAQIFSLEFATANTSREGMSGNVEWSHDVTTMRSQFAFNQAEPFWQDERHRFTIIVRNPGPSTTLTLRTNITQGGDDESGGYDNFLVTAVTDANDIIAVAETFTPINGAAGGATPSVLTSDTINGAILAPADVTLALVQSSSPNVSLDTSSGIITVAPGTSAGAHTVEYEICEIIDPTNCSSVIETITVFVPGGGGGACPAGTAEVPGIFHVVSASVTNGGQPNNLSGALGPPLPEGTIVNNENESGTTFFQDLLYDLTGDPDILVPAGTVIQVSLANHFQSEPTGTISSSLDNSTFTVLGSSTPPWIDDTVMPPVGDNTFRYDEYVVPAGGARYLALDYLQDSGGLRFDGVIYNTQCQPFAAASAELTGSKTVTVFDPLGEGLFALPGNDVIYTITVENIGSGEVDPDTLFLADRLPNEVVFFNGDVDGPGPETDAVAFQDIGAGLAFDFSANVGFSNSAAVPTSFADCTYAPASGYDPAVQFVCINPTGAMQGNSMWQVSFRARIE